MRDQTILFLIHFLYNNFQIEKKTIFHFASSGKPQTLKLGSSSLTDRKKIVKKDTFSLVAEKQTKLDKIELTISFLKFYCKISTEILQNPFKSF